MYCRFKSLNSLVFEFFVSVHRILLLHVKEEKKKFSRLPADVS